jgi:hypothetical protein
MATHTGKKNIDTGVDNTPMTTDQINAIPNPKAGWQRFNSDIQAPVYYSNGAWVPALLNA